MIAVLACASGSGCSDSVDTSAQGEAAATSMSCGKAALPKGALRMPNDWTWDAWAGEFDGKLHRWGLIAPKTVPLSEIGENARIGHWLWNASHQRWDYDGICIAPNSNASRPNHVIWSGSMPFKIDGRIVAFVTGRDRAATIQESFVQSIYRSTSVDGKVWNPLEPVLSREAFTAAGYDLRGGFDGVPSKEHGDGIPSSSRDPYVVRDPFDTTKYHMFIGAKVAKPNGSSRATVAHATTHDPLKKWTLGPPIDLPATVDQLEVPNFFYHHDKKGRGSWFAVISATRKYFGEGDSRNTQAIFGYRSEALGGPWKPIYEGYEQRPYADDPSLIDDGYHYAVTVFPRADGGFGALGFHTAKKHKEWLLTGSPVYFIRWEGADGEIPVIPFPQDK